MRTRPDAYTTVPHSALDSTMSLAREGYTFISSRCDRLGTDVFWTRLAGRRAFFLRGASAVELFYGDAPVTRVGAMPKSAQHLLQDEGSVQTLEGEAHRVRKALFLQLLEDDTRATFADELRTAWGRQRALWMPGTRVDLYATLNGVLTESALRFAGLPTGDIKARTHELASMVDRAGTIGPANWWARVLRHRSERWSAAALARIRSGHTRTDDDRIAQEIAWHSDNGALLNLDVAAVELLNILRPIVAISRFLVFAAIALERHPQWAHEFREHPDSPSLEPFAHEVRRFYPFFPLIGARTTKSITWQEHVFPMNSWLILDLYGTNHDRSLWESPSSFRPERFSDAEPAPNSLVAQGGGEHATSHRCPGEWLTMDTIRHGVQFLSALDYTVPPQDLGVPLGPMPAFPPRGLTIAV